MYSTPYFGHIFLQDRQTASQGEWVTDGRDEIT
jgi:hypothetical protein